MSDLQPLLEILRDPDHPAFTAALEKLARVNPATLPAHTLPGLQASLQAVLARLSERKDAAATELEELRRRAAALQSYGTR